MDSQDKQSEHSGRAQVKAGTAAVNRIPSDYVPPSNAGPGDCRPDGEPDQPSPRPTYSRAPGISVAKQPQTKKSHGRTEPEVPK
jgi:hypothetical protein